MQRAAETIAALASPPGGAARALIRISGPRTSEIVRAVWRGEELALKARAAWRGRFDDGRGTQPLLLLWMPAPHSFTREDVAEFHLPGAQPLVRAALERVLALGARAAEAGEFTRRAFHSGRIDLSRAEGVLELVLASNESERAAAAELVAGGLARRVDGLRDELLELRALCEASLDFDESDTGHVPVAELEARAQPLRDALAEALRFERARARRGAEARVVLAGAPNAGKSTLFNALLGRDEALVSEQRGTTRDLLRASFAVGGQACLLIDSAGLEAGTGELGLAAQAYTRTALAGADALLWVVDASSATPAALAAELAAFPPHAPRLLVWNQIDRPGAPSAPDADPLAAAGAPPWVATSALRRRGFDELTTALGRLLGQQGEGAPRRESTPLFELSERHRRALEEVRARLAAGFEAQRRGARLELLAEDLRLALAALDEISGHSTPEDVLERIFARFCIGK